MKKTIVLLLTIVSLFIIGCGGPDVKKEVQTMHDKYINAYNQTWLEIRNEEKPKDWSQELVQKAEKYKNKFEVIKKRLCHNKWLVFDEK